MMSTLTAVGGPRRGSAGDGVTVNPVSADADSVRAALAAAAEAGPFFRLEVLADPAAGEWQPAGTELAGLTARTAAQLGSREPRVAASILHLSLAARLWSPALGCGLLAGVVPDMGALVISAGAEVRLGTTRLAGWRATSVAELATFAGATVGGQLDALAAALPTPLPPGLLRGNSASALTGALGMLLRFRPDLAGLARELAGHLLSGPDLAGAGVLAGAETGALSFRRHSCCLYYRVPGGGLCGDCCLDRPPGDSEPHRGEPDS
jgi:FhuF 2Fe-2S C-terminal domain